MIFRHDLRFWVAAATVLLLVPPVAAAPASGLLDAAAAALARGDGIGAEVAVERALAAGVARDELAALAGEAELLQGDLAAAREWLGPERFAPDRRAAGFHALGKLETIEGNLDAAARAFDRALAEDGGNALLWVDIGRLRYRAGQHRLALEAAIVAVERDPWEPRALEFRGQLARDAEGLLAALPWFERALEKAPDDVDLLGEYAATLGDAGRHRDMLRVARRMVALDPRHPRAYFLQAVLAARAGRDDLARRLLWRTNGAYDTTPAGQLLAGILGFRTGSSALAIDQLGALVRRQPDNRPAALLLGRAQLAAGEAGEVVARLGPAADRADASPYLLTLVGRALERLGRRDEAARYLDRAAGASPSRLGVLAFEPVRRQRGSASRPAQGAEVTVPLLRELIAERRPREALAAARRLAERHPGSADVAKLAGDVRLLAGDPRGALGRYESAAAIRRDFALVERIVAAHRMLGEREAAEAVLSEHVARNPADGDAAALLGRIVAERGEWPRAAELLRRAAALAGGGRDPRLLADLATAEFMSGQAGAAGEAAQRAYALQRANGRVAAVLARIVHANGDRPEQALALLAKADRSAAPELARR